MSGFLHPGMLGLAALAVPLVVLYILKVRRQDHRVASTWLWETSLREVEAQVPFRKLRRDWLLWLQLLILALLVAAAAAPFRRALTVPGDRVALVLDASASMLAGERLDAAREAAARVVDGMGAGDQILLVRAGSRPEVLAPLTEDARSLREAIARFEASPAPADLEAAARFARRVLGEEGSVVLLTDGAARALELSGLEIVLVDGTELDNSGITALSVRPGDASGASQEVFLRVRNGGGRPAAGRIRLLVDGRLRDASALSVPARSEASRTLRLEGIREGVVEALWSIEADDALAADDRAHWILRAPAARKWRFVGGREPWVGRAMASDPDWREAAPGEPADLEIVLRASPEPAGPPFLWIDPLELRREIARGAVVLDTDRSHPALRFVDLHPVRLGRVPSVERPPGARVLAESSAGPLILEGSRGNRAYLLWAFDPAETDLPLRAAFPLLVRNAVEHLAPEGGGLPGGVAAGVPLEIAWPEGGEVRLVAPDGATTSLTPSGGRLRLPPLEKLGVWRIAGAGREERLAVSLLSADESDLSPRMLDRPSGGGAGAGIAAPRATLRGLWRPLAVAALLLLLLESAAFFRRWTP